MGEEWIYTHIITGRSNTDAAKYFTSISSQGNNKDTSCHSREHTNEKDRQNEYTQKNTYMYVQ